MMEYLNIAPVASVIFLFTIVTSIYAFSNQEVYGKFMLHPYSVSKGRKLYTYLTSGLIHADWMHLFFNMFTFFAFAFALEQTIGHWQFGLLYVVSLVLSDVPTVIKHKDNMWYNSLGASGAISGLLFSYILIYPLSTLRIFPLPIDIYAIIFGGLYLLYCYFASKKANDNINHDAHFFGALTGMIMTVVLVPGVIPNFIAQLTGG